MADDGKLPDRGGSPGDHAPPRRLRTATLTTLLVTACASAVVAIGLFPEARYAFEDAKPIDVGTLTTAELSPALTGRYVRARVELEGAPTVGFSRVGESPRRLTLAGPTTGPSAKEAASSQGPAPRFVDYPVSAAVGARFVPPRLVAGRLARVGELGIRHRGLARHLDALAPGAATRGWVLVEGDDPRGVAWIAGVEALVLGFLVWNLASVFRIVRRLPAGEGPASPSA